MKSFKNTIAVILTVTTLSSIAQVSWRIDRQHGHMGFSIKYMLLSDYEGKFKFYDGKVSSKSETDFTDAVFNMMIDINSVSAEDEGHEEMLKGPQFFDAGNYPIATFRSTSMKPAAIKGTYDLEGELTIKGVTKKIKLLATGADKPVINPYFNKTEYAFRITGTIKRSDYGLNGLDNMEIGGMVLGDDVNIVYSLILGKLSRIISMAGANKMVVDEKTATKYVGLYSFDKNSFLSISSEQGKLFSKVPGGTKEEIFLLNDNKFIYEFRDAELEFIKDASGNVSGYSRKVNNKELPPAVKILNSDTLQGTAVFFNGLGWNFLGSKNYDEAIKYFKRGLVLYPGSLALEGNLAHCYLFKKEYASALKIYKTHLNETLAENYTWKDMIKQDFIFFENNKFDKSLMDKVFAELKLEIPEGYKIK